MSAADTQSLTNSEPILELIGVCSGYGQIEVLRDISIKVMPGEIVTIIGANGAGKTSTLLSISGINKIWSGSIRFFGTEIQDLPSHQLVGMGIAQVPEGRKIFPRLTVFENLELGAYTRSDPAEFKRGAEEVFELFPILRDRRSQPGGTLSGGEQQMLAIGRALMSRPKLLLLDEPSMGVAPLVIAKIFETLAALNRSGVTILLVEQNAHVALKLAHRAYVMETGAISFEDQAAKLLDDPRVKDAYLGD